MDITTEVAADEDTAHILIGRWLDIADELEDQTTDEYTVDDYKAGVYRLCAMELAEEYGLV
jgi:hypothetical protein